MHDKKAVKTHTFTEAVRTQIGLQVKLWKRRWLRNCSEMIALNPILQSHEARVINNYQRLQIVVQINSMNWTL